MSDLTKLIQASKLAPELIPTSVRIPEELSLFVEDLMEQLSLSKQEILLLLLKEGEAVARKALNLDVVDTEESNFYLLNTNLRNSEDDHKKMLSEGIAAAFWGDWKNQIDRIKKGDIVFLYANGIGVVAYGKGSGNTEVIDHEGGKDECHYQKLTDFKILKKPLTASEFRKNLKCNFPLLKTFVPVKNGQAVLDAIIKEAR